MGFLRQYSVNHYGGLEADMPVNLPYGDTYLTTDTNKFFKYNQDGLAKEITASDYLPLVGGTITGSLILSTLQASASYLDDAAAATGGVAIGELYRNGSIVNIRIS